MRAPLGRAAWFVAGAGAGVYAVTRARRAAEAFTPEGLADRMAGWSLGAHLFGQEVRAGMEEKETELRRRLGGTHAEVSGRRAAVAALHADNSEKGSED